MTVPPLLSLIGGVFLVAMTPGFVHAIGLVRACGWIAVFVLLLVLIRGMNLSSTLITDISCVLTTLIVAVLTLLRLYCTRCHQARESDTEHAISNENIQQEEAQDAAGERA